MAGGRPVERISGGTDYTLAGEFVPLPDKYVNFVLDYDLKAMSARLAELSHLPSAERFASLRKDMEQFKRPYSTGAFLNMAKSKAKDQEEELESGPEDEEEEQHRESDVKDEADGEDEDDDDDDEGYGEDGEEEILKLQVPNECEPEYKRPRFAEGFGCLAEAAV